MIVTIAADTCPHGYLETASRVSILGLAMQCNLAGPVDGMLPVVRTLQHEVHSMEWRVWYLSSMQLGGQI